MQGRHLTDSTLTSPELTELEKAVLEMAVNVTSDPGATFRKQIDSARVLVRTPSGVGFVTKLKIPGELAVAGKEEMVSLPTVYGEHPHLSSGAEFVLQVKAGKINCIEAFCFEGMWPTDESLFSIRISS